MKNTRCGCGGNCNGGVLLPRGGDKPPMTSSPKSRHTINHKMTPTWRHFGRWRGVLPRITLCYRVYRMKVRSCVCPCWQQESAEHGHIRPNRFFSRGRRCCWRNFHLTARRVLPGGRSYISTPPTPSNGLSTRPKSLRRLNVLGGERVAVPRIFRAPRCSLFISINCHYL